MSKKFFLTTSTEEIRDRLRRQLQLHLRKQQYNIVPLIDVIVLEKPYEDTPLR